MCEAYYGKDFSFDEWRDYALAVNIICAETFKDVIEYCRAVRWNKTGVIWWSLMDMWPMLFNYSVMDWQYNRKLPYHWIRTSQQDFALMAVRVECDGEICLYAANDTLEDKNIKYTVTVYGKNSEGEIIAMGEWSQSRNSSGLMQTLNDFDEPKLLIIEWNDGEITGTNHFFTKIASFEQMHQWIKLIGEEGGFRDEILELK